MAARMSKGANREDCAAGPAQLMAARMSKGANREDCAAGPAQGEGLGASLPPPPVPLFEKKKGKEKKYIFSNKRNL